MTGGQRDELVEARADFILAGAHTAKAFAEHFETQVHGDEFEALMHRGKVRKLLAPLSVLCRKGVTLLAVMLVPSALLGYAAFTSGPGAGDALRRERGGGRETRLRAGGDRDPAARPARRGQRRRWLGVGGRPGAGQVSRIDPGTGAEAARVPVGGEPGAIASGGGAIWVADTVGAAVSEDRPGYGQRDPDDHPALGHRAPSRSAPAGSGGG